MFFYESLKNMFFMFFLFLMFFMCFLMSCFCWFWNKNVQNFKYEAFLMGKGSISWTEWVFCSSIIDYLIRIDGAPYLNW